MKNVKRIAKENFGKSINGIVKQKFSDLMFESGLEGFGNALLEDRGFDKALHKAQLKFNDIVDDYVISENVKTTTSKRITFLVPHEGMSYEEAFERGIIADFLSSLDYEFEGRATTFDKKTRTSVCVELNVVNAFDVDYKTFVDFGFDGELISVKNGEFIVEVV